MKKPEIFKKLTAYDHFMVYLIILSVLKITNVFLEDGNKAGFHFIKLGAALFVISSVVFLAFKYGLDRRKKYQHAVISTLIILLVLSHADLNPVRGILVILLLYISKFLVKYKKQNIFNPVVFAVGITTLFALVIPSMDTPPLDWSWIDSLLHFENYKQSTVGKLTKGSLTIPSIVRQAQYENLTAVLERVKREDDFLQKWITVEEKNIFKQRKPKKELVALEESQEPRAKEAA